MSKLFTLGKKILGQHTNHTTHPLTASEQVTQGMNTLHKEALTYTATGSLLFSSIAIWYSRKTEADIQEITEIVRKIQP